MCFYDGRFKLLTWQCVYSNSSVNDFISLIVPFSRFCTQWVRQEKLPMQCTFVLLICNVWRRLYFCTHPVRCETKQKANKQTLKYKCVYLVCLLSCVFLWPIKYFGNEKKIQPPSDCVLTYRVGAWRWAGFFHLIYLIPFSEEPREAAVGNSFG